MVPTNAGLLVVDGFINSNGPTSIQLTHTLAPNDKKNKPLPELKAQLVVESDDNKSYSLTEKGGGLYSGNFIVDNSKKYRILINTLDKKTYVSDFTEGKQSPPIDSITWEIDEVRRGVQFYVNTHDAKNAARYYNWEFSETWQYHADLLTSWEYINGQVVKNPFREQIFDCWSTQKSTALYLTSTDRLSDDVVHRFPLVFIPANSPKFEIGYHLLVKQSAVTGDMYDYLYNLKRNSEQQGSIFDAQPSHLLGNIHCTSNENEQVLGYVGVQGLSEKAVLIWGGEWPFWFNGRTTDPDCPYTPENLTSSLLSQMLRLGLLVPADNPVDPNSVVPIYQPPICVDCRARGGTNVKPGFWHK